MNSTTVLITEDSISQLLADTLRGDKRILMFIEVRTCNDMNSHIIYNCKVKINKAIYKYIQSHIKSMNIFDIVVEIEDDKVYIKFDLSLSKIEKMVRMYTELKERVDECSAYMREESFVVHLTYYKPLESDKIPSYFLIGGADYEDE